MTTYQGGKKRLGKKIAQVIKNYCLEANLQVNNMPYFEPFVGMGGVLRHFSKEPERSTSEMCPTSRRTCYACDINPDLILMWKEIQNGWDPPQKCTKEHWENLKQSKHHSAERGYLGIVASWSGIFFSSYRLQYVGKEKDFLAEAYRGINEIRPDILSVHFLNPQAYYEFKPKGMLIYCDPPYLNNNFNTKYFSEFDHEKFWQVMREWSDPKLGNIVFISEYTAPKDFKKIWEAKGTFSARGVTRRHIECLFIYSG